MRFSGSPCLLLIHQQAQLRTALLTVPAELSDGAGVETAGMDEWHDYRDVVKNCSTAGFVISSARRMVYLVMVLLVIYYV